MWFALMLSPSKHEGRSHLRKAARRLCAFTRGGVILALRIPANGNR